MDIAALALMIPISAIVLGVGGSIVQSILKSQERRLELRLKAQKGQSGDVTKQLEALRAEIAEMQNTGHQFDISFDAALERLESRVSRIETKSAVSSSAAAAEAGQTLRNGQSQ